MLTHTMHNTTSCDERLVDTLRQRAVAEPERQPRSSPPTEERGRHSPAWNLAVHPASAACCRVIGPTQDRQTVRSGDFWQEPIPSCLTRCHTVHRGQFIRAAHGAPFLPTPEGGGLLAQS